MLQKQEKIIINHSIKSEHKTPVLINYLHKYGNKMIFQSRNKLSIFTQVISGQNHLANNHSKHDPTKLEDSRTNTYATIVLYRLNI